MVGEVGMLRIRCMNPVPGFGEKCPTGKTCVADLPLKRVVSKAEVARMDALGSLK